MKILVFGGTGAMGIPVVRILAENGNAVSVTTRRYTEDKDHIHYIVGNAHDLEFVKNLLNEPYDVLIDFMVYTEDEFRDRVDLILSKVRQYVFLSSSRVYAASDVPMTEKSERLLDVCKDTTYLQTAEYALAKAREEDILYASTYKNWTIIRPYITYNVQRLQLGVLEKEYWLRRALEGKTIVFSKDIADKYTTLTFGDDVSRHIVELIGNEKAFGEVFHITNDKAIKWADILELYSRVIKRETGKDVRIKLTDNDDGVSYCLGSYYQIHYDRCYNRKFDSGKVNAATEDSIYTDTLKGLDNCVTQFIHGEQRFLWRNWRLEGYFDRVAKEKTRFREIKPFKQKIVYLIYRYTPFVNWKIQR